MRCPSKGATFCLITSLALTVAGCASSRTTFSARASCTSASYRLKRSRHVYTVDLTLQNTGDAPRWHVINSGGKGLRRFVALARVGGLSANKSLVLRHHGSSTGSSTGADTGKVVSLSIQDARGGGFVALCVPPRSSLRLRGVEIDAPPKTSSLRSWRVRALSINSDPPLVPAPCRRSAPGGSISVSWRPAQTIPLMPRDGVSRILAFDIAGPIALPLTQPACVSR